MRIPASHIQIRIEPEPTDHRQNQHRNDHTPDSHRAQFAGDARSQEIGSRADPKHNNRGNADLNRRKFNFKETCPIAHTGNGDCDVGQKKRNTVGVVGHKVARLTERIFGVAAHTGTLTKHTAFGKSVCQTKRANSRHQPRQNGNRTNLG